MAVPTFRLAAPHEIADHERRLYPLQDRVFAVAARYRADLVLTGGTALARCYFGHRLSDDIDLFTALPQAGRVGRDFANALRDDGLTVEPVIGNPTFFRALVSDGSTPVQVDVAPDSPRVLDAVPSRFGVFVHTLRDIAANKIGAYENRTEVKDAVDLFYLSQALSWKQMFEDAERKRVPIAYEDLQHFLSQPLTGSALLTRAIAPAAFEEFVATLQREIVIEIKKKVVESSRRIPEIVASLLWDTPPEDRTVNERTRLVLARRLEQLPLPQRLALASREGNLDDPHRPATVEPVTRDP